MLKFIPINIHVENFIVKSEKDRKIQEYEFTTCGAFTTHHYNDSSYSKEKFDPENGIFLNNNFIFFVIHTFKIIISLTDDLNSAINIKNNLETIDANAQVSLLK